MSTAQDFIAEAEIALNNHTPYVYGGTSLTKGCDCSGLVYAACIALGIQVPRTSQGQWAGLPHVSSPIPGDLILFDVPSDGTAPGDQPGHVAIFLGPNRMLQEPHTGAFAEITSIPNVPQEWIMGYCRIPQLTQQSPPPPAPVHLKVGKMNCTDPATGGEWIVDLDGHVEGWGTNGFGGINQPGPWGDWKDNGVVWGIRAAKDADGRWGYDIIYRHNTPFSPPGGPPGQYFSPFHFDRPAGQ